MQHKQPKTGSTNHTNKTTTVVIVEMLYATSKTIATKQLHTYNAI